MHVHEKMVREALKHVGAEMVRLSGNSHEVWRLPNGRQHITMRSGRSTDPLSWRANITQLKKALAPEFQFHKAGTSWWIAGKEAEKMQTQESQHIEKPTEAPQKPLKAYAKTNWTEEQDEALRIARARAEGMSSEAIVQFMQSFRPGVKSHQIHNRVYNLKLQGKFNVTPVAPPAPVIETKPKEPAVSIVQVAPATPKQVEPVKEASTVRVTFETAGRTITIFVDKATAEALLRQATTL